MRSDARFSFDWFVHSFVHSSTGSFAFICSLARLVYPFVCSFIWFIHLFTRLTGSFICLTSSFTRSTDSFVQLTRSVYTFVWLTHSFDWLALHDSHDLFAIYLIVVMHLCWPKLHNRIVPSDDPDKHWKSKDWRHLFMWEQRGTTKSRGIEGTYQQRNT